MTSAAIYAALTNGVMKSQTSGLSTQEVMSLLVYIAPAGDPIPKPAFEKSCSGNTGLKPGASAWGGWSPSVTNSRYQDAKAAGLAAADVPRLKLKWAFNLGQVTMARGQPVVAGDRVFVATVGGDVYALDAASGCVHWAFKATASLWSGVTVGDANGVPAVFFGDRSAVMYAVNAAVGRAVMEDAARGTSTRDYYCYAAVLQRRGLPGFLLHRIGACGVPKHDMLFVPGQCCRARRRDRPHHLAKLYDCGTSEADRNGEAAGPLRRCDLVDTHHR